MLYQRAGGGKGKRRHVDSPGNSAWTDVHICKCCLVTKMKFFMIYLAGNSIYCTAYNSPR